MDFGIVSNGQSNSKVFTISSIGDVAIEIQNIEVVGSSSYTIQWDNDVFLLDPEESRDIVVTYQPNSIDEYAGVHITSNAIESTQIVGLQGSGSSAISVTPSVVSLYSSEGESMFLPMLWSKVSVQHLWKYMNTTCLVKLI